MDEGIIVPIVFFMLIGAVLIAPRYFKSVERRKMADTLLAAIEKGQQLPPEMIEAMTSDSGKSVPSPQRDLRVGLVWMGIAAGFVALGVAVSFEEPDALYPLLGCAAFPGFIGLAFLIMFLVSKDRR